MRVVAIAVVALVATACGQAPSGGTGKKSTRVVLESTSKSSQVDLDSVVSVMQKRLDELGVEEARVSLEGDQIVVILPNARVNLALVKQTGRLEFFDLQKDLVADVSLDADGFPRPSRRPLEERPNTVVVTCTPPTRYCPGLYEPPARTYYYLFKYRPDDNRPVPELTGEDIERASQDFDPATNEPIVLMQFSKGGAKKFEQITLDLAERGHALYSQGGGDYQLFLQQFAIVFDRDLKTAPTIDFRENPSGIPGDSGAQITGIPLNDAKDLALLLRTGSLPFELRIVSKKSVHK